MHCNSIVKLKTLFYSLNCSLSFWLSLPLFISHKSQLLPPHSLSHISLVQNLHRCWVLDFEGLISGLGLDQWARIGWWWVWIGWLVGLNRWIRWSVGGSVGLIVGSFNGGSDGDFFFFFEWVWFWFWFDGGGVALGWWILIWAEFCYGFCLAEVGVVTKKLDSGGGSGGDGWLREKEK